MDIKKFRQYGIPLILVVGMCLLAIGFASDNDVSNLGKAGLIMMLSGGSAMIIGIFWDRYKQSTPLVNLGLILCGSVLAIIALVSLGWMSKEFEKWVSGIAIVLVILTSMLYCALLVGKKQYETVSDEQD